MAVANVLCNSSIQRRFHADPLVASTERLLHEKAPRTVVLEPAPEFEPAAAAAEKSEERGQEGLLETAKLNSAA